MTAPLPVPRVFRFDDVDAFRSSIRNLDVEFTPLARKISAEQVILSLPGCELNYTQSFPRIVDAQLAPQTTAVGFTMDDGVPIRFNGVERDRAVIVLGGGGAFYSSVEETPRQYASVMFTPEIVDRGWPQAGLHFSIHEISQRAQDRLREVVRHILLVTSQPTDDAPFASGESIKETLLAAIDNAFAEIVPAKWTTRANTTRQFKVFNDARAILAGDVAHPIYSGELARQIGVSVRTLHDAIQRYRGISLHRYLRLRRLWLVRQQLLAGAPSVKTCALAYGFWHLSDFSRSYRSQFGEAPSETLAASRRPGVTDADPSRRHGS
ncbi:MULTISPECIES: AraC family transcriptional regulator [Bradyrhizobium]|uniref:AraC family transcriptional regulator n=1 Tax=Bradyrhizobium TaxID=374 RepID=UPI0004BC2743|nr:MULTISPECIES: AraC family transcriptional regulator [Bradyrhizobium]MCS3449057.1 AraC family ethanolamine operon transcriptional activator [Bradyrhizobium elkanii]MCS3559800.1 AraC family ethanolamine operon transcriptional activator [Bradyrhizobium elkanii]MCW2150354.1 AraC family ethanolamine operon transcriptional activator [Bradyrhizobium elkanii]MCW2359588.1 AraC family ethanolamine operon transcriptional activator [Bradyrhizobium elkanii]MCW2374085.1 AraC family ethanolamine operon tr